MIQYMGNALPFGNVVVAPATAAIVSGQGLVDALKQTPADVAILVPSVVAELAQDPELLDYCAKHLELIIYIGGDLPQAIGDRVAAKVQLRCQWGASEVGIPQQLIPEGLGPLDWRYVQFHPCVGAVFDEVTDGTYELVIRRDEALADTQPTFSIRGLDKLEKEYRTRDLFEPHPTVPNAWCWRARADDIIVFLNGEKTNPVSMEQHVLARNHELISGAIVIGAQRFQAALLIEPATAESLTTAEQAALIERVWPSVEEANRAAPAHARVEKTLILVTPANCRMVRAGKGTIQRMASIKQYEAEIEKLYADVEAAVDDDDAARAPLNLASKDVVAQLIRDSVSAVIGQQLSVDNDMASFFDRGMDSLQALQLTRALRRVLHRTNIALSTVYQNPTVEQLASALLEEESSVNGPGADQELMAPLLATYRGLIHEIPTALGDISSSPLEESEGIVDGDVLLTGSTGTLGTYLLRALLDRPSPSPKHIFCLNRSPDGGLATQHSRFEAAGLSTADLNERVTFLQADLAQPRLGLDEETYVGLRKRVRLVVHNAWPVNFNLGLTAFGPLLKGLVGLFGLLSPTPSPEIEMETQPKPPGRRRRFVFISSVGAVGGLTNTNTNDNDNDKPDLGVAAPEAILSSLTTPFANGYARSKFLAEILCDTAAKHLGPAVSVAVARVGQVAGAVRQLRPRGAEMVWNRAEWFPSLVVGSLRLGCLPSDLGAQFSEVDWLPVDVLADVVVDLALLRPRSGNSSSSGNGADVFNLRNPHTVPWETLIPAVAETAKELLSQTLQVVSPAVWLARLNESMAGATKGESSDLEDAVKSNPAIKLLDFYRDGLWAENESKKNASSRPMAVERACAGSETLRGVSPVTGEWMRRWVEEWIGGL